MARESGLRQRIANMLRENGFFVQSIESETNPGMPDMYYRFNREFSGWLELKHVKEMPKRSTTSVFKSLNHPLLTEQAIWIGCELDHGGNADILVSYERRYFLVPGEQAPRFNSFTESDLSLFEFKKKDIVTQLRWVQKGR